MTTPPQTTRRRAAAGLVLAAAIVVPAAGCVHGRKLSEVRPSTTTTITIPVDAEAVTASTVERPTTLEGVGVRLEEVGALDDPVAIAARPGWPHLTVAERNGRLRQLSANYRYDGDGQPAGADYRVESWTMLDIGRQVDQGDGGGVRGVTYSSDGRRMYLSYISSDGAVVVDQYRTGEGDLDTSSRFQLLRVEAPDGLRRGGALAFGRDGFLYVGVGTPDGDPARRNGRTRCTARCCASTPKERSAIRPTPCRPATRTPPAAAPGRCGSWGCTIRVGWSSTGPRPTCT
ncbi:MAG: hypothetical protein R2690_09155 [Acidimicrobiales bacterium]